MKLVAIELENFQAFKEPVRIEFSPITLFFGPNSAGKSAVMDALDFLREFWNPERTNDDKTREHLWRWAHDSGTQERSGFRLAVEIRDEIESAYGRSFLPDFDVFRQARRPFQQFLVDPDQWENEDSYPDFFRYEIVLGKSGPPDLGFNRTEVGGLSIQRIVMSADGNKRYEPIVDMHRPGAMKDLSGSDFPPNPMLNWGKDYLTEADEKFIENLWLFRLYRSSLIPDLQHPSLSDIPLHEKENEDPQSGLTNFCNRYIYGLTSAYYGLSPYSYWYPHPDNTDWDKHLTFQQAVSQVFHYFGNHVHQTLVHTRQKVLADRTVPPKADLLFPVDGIYVGPQSPTQLGDYTDFNLIPEKFPKEHPYRLLAEWSHPEYIHRLYQENKSSLQLELDAEEFRNWITESADRERFCEVNRYLSDFLFKERGYQVSTLSTFLLAGVEIADGSVGAEDFLSNPALIRIRLKDSSGSTREIEEVGSGIGFVLPVLISILSNKISQIQQPELHLHPALQSELADILIDRFTNDSTKEAGDAQCIVETHSEHLLLRLLRRIRDTAKGIETALKASPSDVAVYYFNPSITGTTEIRKMLITPMGDFYNTWPRGFFDERSKDLFE